MKATFARENKAFISHSFKLVSWQWAAISLCKCVWRSTEKDIIPDPGLVSWRFFSLSRYDEVCVGTFPQLNRRSGDIRCLVLYTMHSPLRHNCDTGLDVLNGQKQGDGEPRGDQEVGRGEGAEKESPCEPSPVLSCWVLLSGCHLSILCSRERGTSAERDSLQQMAELCSAEVRNSPLARPKKKKNDSLPPL